MFAQLVNLAISLLAAYLIVRYYRARSASTEEKYSTFGPRFWTGLVDGCVMWPIGFVIFLVNLLSPPVAVIVALMVVQQSAWLFYTIALHAKYGQTVGKMACKVKVVDYETEGPISLQQAVLREGIPAIASLGALIYEIYLVVVHDAPLRVNGGTVELGTAFWGVAAIPLAWFLAEVVTMLTNDKRRALHDLIAGTVVIRTNSTPTVSSIPSELEVR